MLQQFLQTAYTDNVWMSLDITDSHTRQSHHDIIWYSQIILMLQGHTSTAAETHMHIFRYASSPIAEALEVKPQLEDVIVKLTAKASLVWIFPLTVDNLESNILHKTQWKQSQHMHLYMCLMPMSLRNQHQDNVVSICLVKWDIFPRF